ncbi:MAG: TonB-dependent receptor, partial [Woeseiaceae bacterium]|nr:TonB-dependent receptor [Woeseiaceae bacterium]
MSVQVLSGEFLADANTDSLYDLQFNVPGLVVNNVGGFGARFALRGITDQGGTGLAVATHVNGVYLGDSQLALGRLFDLERVEILKGPQGTLYGRNSTGGSINFITRAPRPDFEAAIESSYGSFATAGVQASVNVPLGDSAVRIAFAGANGEGFIRNTVDDRRFAEDDFWGLRGSWRLIVDERLDVTLTAQRVVDDGAGGELWLPNPAFLPDPSDIHLTTVTLADPFLKTENDFAGLDAVYDFGTLSLRSVTGFAHSDSRDRDDCAGLPFLRDCVREILPAKHRQFSQEFQLTSAGDGEFDWLVGVNYYDADDSTRFFQFTPAINPLPTFNYRARSSTSAYAVFGEASLLLAEHWTVTGGLRYSHEERRVSSVGTGTQDNPVLRTADSDWGRVSWRVNLAYAPSPNTMLYTGISTGFKSGGVTTQR